MSQTAKLNIVESHANPEPEDRLAAMQARDRELISCINALVDSDFSAAPTGNDELSQAFAKLLERQRSEASAELSRVVDLSVEVNEASIHTAELFASLQRVNEQSSAISSTAEQMAEAVKEADAHSTNIATEAQQARAAAESGAESVTDVIKHMDNIAQSVERGTERVAVLTDFSSQIGNITANIKKIADQTNLLALNATIEAARAGEAGKGFAVVAGEVKSLSNQTADATKEIDKTITDLQNEMEGMLLSMQDSTEAVSSGQEVIERLKERMEGISVKVNEVSVDTDNISSALSEQGQSANEIAARISEIASGSTDSVIGIENTVKAVDALQSLINRQLTVLSELDVPDKIIYLAKSDHIIWKKRLADMLVGREGLRENELNDHNSCRLGKWYNSVADSQYRNNPNFSRLLEPHRRVHTHGKEAVALYNRGEDAAALGELAKVNEASVEVLQLLDTLAER